MKNIRQNTDGTYSLHLYLKEAEHAELKQIAKAMRMNEFDALKYAIRLVNWWSKGQIEPSEEK